MNKTIQQTIPYNELYTPDEVCSLLKIKMSKLRTMVFRKEIKVVRIGRLLRFKHQDIIEMLHD